MSADRVIASYLRLAKEDLEDALVLEARGSRNAVYHLEQAAEKLTRAVLTSEGKHGGIGHQLHAMIAQIPDENPLKVSLRAIEHLAAYATTYRYPTPVGRVTGPPPPETFARDAKNVGAALDEAAMRFGVDLSRIDSAAHRPGPIR